MTESSVGVLLATVLVTALGGCSPAGGDRDRSPILVFAAASLRDALVEIEPSFREASGVAATFNFAGSNVLALQIEASGAADVYLSADSYWVDFLGDRGLLAAGTRTTFLSNRLVLVARRDSELAALAPLEDLASLPELDFRYLSVADPAAVPAGRYARRALESRTAEGDLWRRLENRLAPAADVRAALALVESRDDTLGIVYRSDALSSDRVVVLAEIPADPIFPIRYQAAALDRRPRQADAERFLRFLTGERAAAIFARHGFETASDP